MSNLRALPATSLFYSGYFVFKGTFVVLLFVLFFSCYRVATPVTTERPHAIDFCGIQNLSYLMVRQK
jgi:hypothetical protein